MLVPAVRMLVVAFGMLVVMLQIERGWIDQTKEERPAFASSALVQQLVDEALATSAAMHEHVLHRDQLVHVRSHLEVAPTAPFAHFAIREPVIAPRHPATRAFTRQRAVDRAQETPRLRRELVERTAEHFVRKLVRERDVGRRDFDVLDRPRWVAVYLSFALMLMQKRRRADERRYFM